MSWPCRILGESNICRCIFGIYSAIGKHHYSFCLEGQHAATLHALNTKGAGVFAMVNRGDELGRKAKNMIEIRALFIDMDVRTTELDQNSFLLGVPNGVIDPRTSMLR